MTTREILTLQFGHYSNFIGTHWWNIQETNFSYDSNNPSEVNHDVLYREGETPRRETTYTPRLLLVDLKGTLGYLNERGNLYDSSQDKADPSLLWDSENVSVTTEPAVPKTPFVESLEKPLNSEEPKTFDFENDVDTWVDYLLARFHPRTVNIVKEYTHECSTQAFDVFHYGCKLWNSEQFQDDFTDRIRAYVEECDLLQGFQVLLDSTDGFSGLGVSCVQHLRDEYGKSLLAFPSMDSKNLDLSASSLIKTVNTALCWQKLGEHSSLFSPLSCGSTGWPQAGDSRVFDNLTYIAELKYHSSAILATALDTLTLRYRNKEYPHSALSDLCADLNKLGRKAAATSLSLPFPMTVKRDLIDILDDFEGSLWTSLTPSCDISMDKNMQTLALRGVPEARLKRPVQDAKKQMGKPAYRCSTVHEMMTLYLACSCHASATHLTTIKSPLKIKNPYPKIFNNNIHENGDVSGWPVGEDVKSTPVMAGLHSGNSLSSMFESLYNQANRVKSIKKFPAFVDSGLEQDEFMDCLHHLLDCKEAYEDHYV